MKKYLLILVFLVFFLTGCQKKESTNIDFYQTSIIFSKQIENFLSNLEEFGYKGAKNTNTFLNINGENQDFKINGKFLFSGFFDFFYLNQNIHTNISMFFWDKKEQKETIFSGNTQHIKIGQDIYFKINNLSFDIGPGNYQENLISLLLKKIENKRIFSNTQKQTKTKEKIRDINFLLQTLSSLPVFDTYDTVKYKGELAYKIDMQSDIIEYINQNTDLAISEIKGLFVVKTDSEVEFKIESIKSLKNDLFFIKGTIGKNIGSLDIKNHESPNIYYNISWNFYKKNFSFSISQIKHFQKIFSLDIKVNHTRHLDHITNKITGLFVISPQIIYGSDLEKEIKININAIQTIFEYTGKIVSKPDSYIFLDQLLGDEFSLKSLLSDN